MLRGATGQSRQVGDEEGYSSDSAQSTDSDESVMPLPSQLSRSDGGMEDEFFEVTPHPYYIQMSFILLRE